MVNEVDAVTNHWAVLIGINFYVNSLNPLKGCVRDVESIKQYLEAASTPVNVDIFRASAPSDPNSLHPAEEPDSWPTFENVTSSLKKITAEAKPGDFVYIHYSGHGTQMEASSSEYSNRNTGDLALVLFDDVHGCRYLRGLELAYLLDEMVKMGLFVTLVLDCCFSGSVVRLGDPHGDAIRAVDYDHAIDAAYPQCLGTSPSHQIGFSTVRDIRMLPTWLVDPNGYTILTACGPHEIARELTLEGEKRNGALSHFLLRALTSLRKSSVEITHQSLYQYLRVRFHASWPQQSPMRYGNKNLSFFGKLRPRPDIAFISVFRTQKDNRLCLAAGHAHGVYKDDEYAVYPFDSSEDVANNAKQASVKVRVDAVRGLTSDLVGINPMSATSQVKTGWKARPLTHLPPKKVLVRHMDYGDNQSQWVAAAEQRRFLRLSTEDVESQPCLFNVTRNGQNEYEILDGSYQKITSLPSIPLDRKGALDSVVDLLEHLAAFKYIEGIENRIPTTSFEESFRIHLSDGIGSDLEAAGLLDVKHNDRLSLKVQNNSDKPLYLYIYDLGPSWQIDGLICNDGGGDYKVVLPKNEMKGNTGQEKMVLQMTVPESFRDRGEHKCEDILKVFITNRPSSFAALVLPKIPISAEDIDEPLRGNHNQLSKFLSELTTPFRGAEDGISDEEWVARNFVIRTHYDKGNA
jgi:Caspase domain